MNSSLPTNSKLLLIGDDDRYIITHDLETKEWKEVCRLTDPLRFFKVARLGNRVVIAGGNLCGDSVCVSRQIRDSIHLFDCDTNTVRYDCGVLPQPLSMFQMCSAGTNLYVMGGKTHENDPPISNLYKCFDDGKWIWDTLSPMPDARWDFSSVVYDKFIYIFGGRTVGGIVSSCAKYEIETNVWSPIAESPKPLSSTACAVRSGEIYMVGGNGYGKYGEEEVSDVYIYNVETDSWRSGPFLESPRANLTLVDVKGRLYAIGGVSGDDILGSYEVLEGNEWVEHFDSLLDGFLDGGVVL